MDPAERICGSANVSVDDIDWRALYLAQAAMSTGIDYRLRAVEDAVEKIGEILTEIKGERPWRSLTEHRPEPINPLSRLFRKGAGRGTV